MQALVAHPWRNAEVLNDKKPWRTPWLSLIPAARANKRAEVIAALTAMPSAVTNPKYAPEILADEALVWLELGDLDVAIDRAQQALAHFNERRSFSSFRFEIRAILGSLLVARGKLEEARIPLEELVTNANEYVFDYYVPFGQFALARVLWANPKTRARARRLAIQAAKGFEWIGPGRDADRKVVADWLAAPDKPARYLLP